MREYQCRYFFASIPFMQKEHSSLSTAWATGNARAVYIFWRLWSLDNILQNHDDINRPWPPPHCSSVLLRSID